MLDKNTFKDSEKIKGKICIPYKLSILPHSEFLTGSPLLCYQFRPTSNQYYLWGRMRPRRLCLYICNINMLKGGCLKLVFTFVDILTLYVYYLPNQIKPNQIKSNQIKFYLKSAMYIWKKRKISKKLFTQLYSVTNSNKLYIWFKYVGTSLWNRTWPQMKIYVSEF